MQTGYSLYALERDKLWSASLLETVVYIWRAVDTTN